MQPHFGFVCALFGSVITFAFGIWPESLTLLLVLMAIDYLTGVIAALREGEGLHSNTGFWGMVKKGLMLLVILLAHRVDVLLGSDMIMGGAIAFYAVNELLSVIENYGRIGLPLPPQIRRLVRVLRDRQDPKDPPSSDS
ncbi:holin family protein [Cohnella faecalis]|uniref:phage holin family protein n=1 Tax=Cohnella faecalis TaxID=2315694 RepID=UPI00361F84F2